MAENALGGKPTLIINSAQRAIELRFVPPPSKDCVGSAEVYGLKGSFGPLEPGVWMFYCNRSGAWFYLEFEVGSAPGPSLYYVDTHAKGRNDGSNWTNAFTRLQSALAVASGGCEIRVAQGVYRPDRGPLFYAGDPNAVFRLTRGIVLKGGYGGSGWPRPDERDLVAHETVLSGDLSGNDQVPACLCDMLTDQSRFDNSYHVVVTSGADSTTVLDGFTITGGVAAGSHEPDKRSCGGGIFNADGSPTIRNCLIVGNACGFYGGGIYSSSRTAPTVTNCTVTGNWAQWWGGGIYNEWDGELVVTRCAITGNGAEFRGGGLCCHTDGLLDVANCIVSGNMALESSFGKGGALYCTAARVNLLHCTLVGNRAGVGSSIACDSLDHGGTGEIRVDNCILWDGEESLHNGDNSLLEIMYSDVQGGWPGSGNIAADPRFVQMGYWDSGATARDPDDDIWFEGDYHLQWDSPCIDAGDPRWIPDAEATDLDGRPRLSGAAVDMGVYEVGNEAPVPEVGPWLTGFSLDGKTGDLTLDASGSHDPEGQALSYRWYLDGSLVSRHARFTMELPLGSHSFELVVSDSVGVSTSLEVIGQILEPIETTMNLTPATITQRGTSEPITASILLPPGRKLGEFASSEKLLLYAGGIEATGQSGFVWLGGKVIVVAKFDRAKFFAVGPTYGEVKVEVVGRLTDGNFFSAKGVITLQ
ncbi:MAG: right-handed parallel beta-helix repeat-containing protein [Sedimentisphaerales bacterium]|nr:right-handed parallel beta-helix repeat-containing protein [Sedimentisphaerales bacterium]